MSVIKIKIKNLIVAIFELILLFRLSCRYSEVAWSKNIYSFSLNLSTNICKENNLFFNHQKQLSTRKIKLNQQFIAHRFKI